MNPQPSHQSAGMFSLAQIVKSAQCFQFHFVANISFLKNGMVHFKVWTSSSENSGPAFAHGSTGCSRAAAAHLGGRVLCVPGPDLRLRLTSVYHMTPGRPNSSLLPAQLGWVLDSHLWHVRSDSSVAGRGSPCRV